MRITLAVFCYNQAAFVQAAVESALFQRCAPIEIVISDDCSTDQTYGHAQAAVRSYAGPHRVVLRRNSTNLGMGRHFNEVMREATGELVILMAGDDICLPTRVARVADVWDSSNQRLNLIASHVFDMSPSGVDLGVLRVDRLQDWKRAEDWAVRRPYVIGAAHAITRRLFEEYGPLRDDVQEEDQVNTLRAILSGAAYTIEEPLVRYRRGGLSSGVFEPAGYPAFEKRRSARYLAGFRQFIQDATIAGCEPLISDTIGEERERALFVEKIAAERSVLRRVALARVSLPNDDRWRWKMLFKLTTPRAAFLTQRVLNRIVRAGSGQSNAARMADRMEMPPQERQSD